ncbi:hypothetical protein JBE04_20385 [Streptomyces sp. PRKS01-29]|nr:hypothetical protein [Streptomyces sabulosicollis]MBI0296752.1 hypothetical protein [Streptomyces sabulosicollis]
MATTAAETLEQEYHRLLAERANIQATARAAGETSTEAREQMTAVMDRLREILAIPPDGYTLPTPAAKLIAHAHAHGWLGETQWTAPGWHGEPFVAVKVGRRMEPGELEYSRSDVWLYQLTWHSRGCPPGKLRLFGSGLSRTPENPATHDAPSIKAITAVITQHPGPDAASLALF